VRPRIVAVTTIALERGLLVPGGDGATLSTTHPRNDPRAATLRAASRRAAGPEEDTYASTAWLRQRAVVRAARRTDGEDWSRQLRADVAFGGAFYAIVDSEAVGLPIDVAHLPELRRVGMEIKHAIESAHTIVHPLDPACAASTARSSPARRATSAPIYAT
jgi:hypothetical protein